MFGFAINFLFFLQKILFHLESWNHRMIHFVFNLQSNGILFDPTTTANQFQVT